MINHQGRYTTVYDTFALRQEAETRQRVAQGSVIGYVGMTGITSGPHLHYEFKVDGMQRDPLRVALPNAQPVKVATVKLSWLKRTISWPASTSCANTNLAKLD